MLGVPLDGACKGAAFEITADLGQRLGTHRMVHRRILLPMIGAFVEIGSDVVRGGADQLDAAPAPGSRAAPPKLGRNE